MGLRIVLTSIVTAVALVLCASEVGADTRRGRGTVTPNDDGATVTAVQLGSAGAPVRSTGGTVSCSYIDVGTELDSFGYSGLDGQLAGFTPATELVEGQWYYVACTINGTPRAGRFFQYTPGEAPIDARLLALEAVDTLTIAFPSPSTSPPADFQQLVGLRTWMWIDEVGFEPISATASIPGLSVTATASPTQVVWDMGDGSEAVVCDSPGTPYDTALADDQQSTDCSHLFQVAGDYTAHATVTWTTEWSATNGAGGTLPGIERSTTFGLDVIERQAVIIENP